jgi:uncharacterized lipoprotein YddW (UPF0748 family)
VVQKQKGGTFMTKTIKALCVLLGLICCAQGLLPAIQKGDVQAKEQFVKGVWAATLYSMDYPSAPTSDAKKLKSDADKLINDVQSHGFDTLFLQVRPSGDAFYKSNIYPWSKYLTGTLGIAPTDDFDPLDYIINLAHKKGISVHAWLNPYRITASKDDTNDQNEQSIANKYPNLVVKHTDNKLYLNPGEPDAIKLVIDGAMEIVNNYDIDGIHIDDYFYPSSAFPDSETFARYGGDFRDIGDWRRNNTTQLVKELNSAIKKAKPNVLFSASPAGIWANKASHPDGSNTSGKQTYYDYYADTRLWVKDELIDIIIPQIYWNIGYSIADFETLSNWWNDVADGTNVKLLIGQGVYRAAEETNPTSAWYGQKGHDEIQNQLRLIKRLSNCSGYVQYRLGCISKNSALSNLLTTLNTQGLPLFSDTQSYPWAKDAIERLFANKIVNGMGDETFGCSLNISRADFMVMLVRLTKQNVPFTHNFADVTEDKYYFKEVGMAKALGYTTGRSDNIFDPSGKISREDMATLVWRVMSREGKLPSESKLSLSSTFSDANEISEYARIAIAVLTEHKLLSGYETGEFKPKGLATRAECAVLLNNLLDL